MMSSCTDRSPSALTLTRPVHSGLFALDYTSLLSLRVLVCRYGYRVNGQAPRTGQHAGLLGCDLHGAPPDPA